MKFIRSLVYSFLTLGALASQCDDAKKYGKSLDTGSISFKCSDGKVTEFKLSNVVIGKEDIKVISKFTKSQKIEFNGCEYAESLDSSYFKDFSKLTYLSVSGELPAFKYAKHLKTLEILGNTSIDKDDIKIISKFTELEKLKIDVREVDTRDLSYLKSLKHLKEFKLVDDRSEDNLCDFAPKEIKSICYPKATSTKKTSTKKTSTKKTSTKKSSTKKTSTKTKTTESEVADTSIVVIYNDELVANKGSKSIKEIELYRLPLNQEGLDALATLTNLETVELTLCDYNSGNLDASSLKNLNKLRKLVANSRHDVKIFKNNKTLKSLRVHGNTSLSKDDIKIIAGFTNLEKLDIDVREIDTTDLSALKSLKKLKELRIEDSRDDVNFCQKVPKELRSICKTSYTTVKSSTKTTKTTKTTKKSTKKTTKTTKTTKKSLPTNSTDKCGNGVAICKKGYCCSKYGYCGKSSDYCKVSRGCQSEFGECKN